MYAFLVIQLTIVITRTNPKIEKIARSRERFFFSSVLNGNGAEMGQREAIWWKPMVGRGHQSS